MESASQTSEHYIPPPARAPGEGWRLNIVGRRAYQNSPLCNAGSDVEILQFRVAFVWIQDESALLYYSL